MTRDPQGNLFGLTDDDCSDGSYGGLYELSAGGTLTVLHSFDGSDGSWPSGEVLRTDNGTLFGTAQGGGTYDAGKVWKYVP